MKKEVFEKIRLVALVGSNRGKQEKALLLHEGAEFSWLFKDEIILKGKSIGEMRECLLSHFAGYPVRIVNFGVLYTLPERDEVGQYALFHQARNSYKVSNGVVFDPAWGFTYKVDFLSQEGAKMIEELESNVEP